MFPVILLLVALMLRLAHGFSPSPPPLISPAYQYHHGNDVDAWRSAATTKDDDGGDGEDSSALNYPPTIERTGISPTRTLLDRRSALLVGGGAATLGSSGLVLLQPLPSAAAAAAAASSSSSTSYQIPKWTLDDNVQMPTLALNTVGLSVEETTRAVGYAVQSGVTHIDFHPGKERDGVGQYLAQQQQPNRGALFLNTKIRKAPPGTSAEDAAKRCQAQIEDDLAALGVRQVDMLMLRDSPDCDVIQAQWAVLEQALASGQTRSVGVINFCESALQCVLATAKVKPALNYYMLHVGMGPDAHGLRTFGESRGIRTFAYGAAGEPGPNAELLSNKVVQRIAKAHQKSPEQVALRWVLQSGAAVSVRPTLNFGLGTGACPDDGSCESGMQSRASSFTWSLSAKEMAQLDALTVPDDNPTLFSSSGCPGAFVMPK